MEFSMGNMTETKFVDGMTVEQWLAIRKKAGLQIDPATAEVDWRYGAVFDPYEIEPDLPEELQVAGRVYFARSPGSEVWVSFDDLSEVTRNALWEKHEGKLAFPAGLDLEQLVREINNPAEESDIEPDTMDEDIDSRVASLLKSGDAH
jgi:hypothetical protein